MTTTPHPGQYALEVLDLFPSDGNSGVDLTQNVLDIDLYESIFTSSISGTVTFIDTDNFISNFPVLGQEFLKLKISTPLTDGSGKTIDFTQNPLIVYKIISQDDFGNGGKINQLRFASPELIRNYRVRVSKSYKKTPSDIVKDLMGESHIDSNKELFIEESTGVRSIICPNVHPFQFIKRLTRETMSKETGSPHYLFFENCDGYHFRTLQSFYEGSLGGNVVKKLHEGEEGAFEGQEGGSKLQHEFERILNHNIVNANDMLANITTGMLGSKIVVHDIYNKRYTTSTFNYFDSFDKNIGYKRIEGVDARDNPVYNNGEIDRFGNNVGSFPDSKLHLHPTSNVNDVFDAQHYEEREGGFRNPYSSNIINMWLQNRNSRFMELKNGVGVTAQVYGDTNMRVGDLVSMNFTNPLDDGGDKSVNGLYLISNLRHNFSQTTPTMHTTFIQGVRDSRPDSPPEGSTVEPKQIRQPAVNQVAVSFRP